MKQKGAYLKVPGRKRLLYLFPPSEKLVARDQYNRLWIRRDDGRWACYGSLFQAVGEIQVDQ
jgi:hypothetical protein